MQFRTVFHGSDPEHFVSGLFLIRRIEEWVARWQTLHRSQDSAPELPAIDFDRTVLVQLASGYRSTLGHAVTIEEVALDGDTLVVTATEKRNVGAGLRAISAPAHVVAVDLGDRPVNRLLLHLSIGPLEDDD